MKSYFRNKSLVKHAAKYSLRQCKRKKQDANVAKKSKSNLNLSFLNDTEQPRVMQNYPLLAVGTPEALPNRTLNAHTAVIK